jgi:sugar phosphate isomerase/epimerase
MRLAFSTLGCPDWTLERVVRAAAEHGYEGIELRILDGELLSPSLPRHARRTVRSTLERGGVALCCVDTSFEIANPDADLREALAFVDLAADLGGPIIRIFAGAPMWEPPEATAVRTAERLGSLADHGRRVGVRIAVETHDSFARGEVMSAMLREAPTDVGVIWDTLNAIIAGETAEVTFRFVADRLAHVHIKDGGSPPDPERNKLFGEGCVPMSSILRLLKSNGYDGWLSVEWEKLWQPSIPDADVALPQYADGLRAALSNLG